MHPIGEVGQMNLTVRDDEPNSQYEIDADGTPAGLAAYVRVGDVTTFTHTETSPALKGQGLGSALARAALDDVRSRGGRVVAGCPFIAAYIDGHPEYQDLLDPDADGRDGGRGRG